MKLKRSCNNITKNRLNPIASFQERGIKDKIRQMAPFLLHPDEREDNKPIRSDNDDEENQT